MKRILSVMLALCILLTAFAALPLSAGAAQGSVSETGADAEKAETGTSSGKVVYLLSDSIGEGFLQHEKYVEKKWLDCVVELNGYDAEKSKMIGESGLGFCSRGAYYGRYLSYYLSNTDFSEADIVIVALGVNDWKDTTVSPSAFFAAMETAFNKIRTDNPDCELYYFSPFNNRWLPTGNYDSYYSLNRAGDVGDKCYAYTLGNFRNLIQTKISEAPLSQYNVTFVNMTECASLNRDTIRDGGLWDSIHPNQATHLAMGDEIAPILRAHGHRLTAHPAVEPTCAAGNTAYWSCSDCGKFFSDEYGVNEIAENSWVVPAVAEHTLIGSPEWSWTGSDAEGYTAASLDDLCSACGSHVGVSAALTKTHTYGKRVYTATATVGGQEYTDTKTVESKALYILGDSIELGESAGGVDYSWVTKLIGLNGYLPYGKNGSKNLSVNRLGFCFPSTTANKTAEGIVNETDFSDADVVIVALGIEDWRYPAPAEKLVNFYPAMYNVFAKIRSDNPYCKIFYVLPFNAQIAGTYDSYYCAETKYRSDYPSCCCGQTLRGFIDLIKAKFNETAYQALDVQLIDMLECDSINRDTIRNGALATLVYPTANTHTALANEIAPLIASNGHRLTAHAAVAATCGTAGNSAYFSCDDCGKFFSDDEAEHEIAQNSWVIPANSSGHHLTAHPAVASNCSSTGNSAYWSCDICGQFFSDAAGKHKIAENSWITPKNSARHVSFNVTSWSWTGSDAEGYSSARVYLTCPSCHASPSMNVPVTVTHTVGRTEYTAALNVATTGQSFSDSKVIEGKVLYVLGDSIAQGFIAEGEYITPTWIDCVIDLNSYSPLSKTLGEDGLGFCTRGAQYQLYLEDYINGTDFSLADIVVVALSINDWKNPDVSPSAFFEQMEFAFNKIRTDNPDCEIYFFSPLNTSLLGDYDSYYSLTRPGNVGDRCFAYSLGDFADLIKEKIESAPLSAYNVTYVDMTECASVNRDTIRDGALHGSIHPTAATHEALGEEIAPILMAHGHRLTAHAAAEATCVAGNTAYWSCDDCGKCFSDEYGVNEIAQNSWVIPAAYSHDYGVPQWTWTGNDADGYTAATVTVICSACGAQETIAADVTKSYTPEKTVYTATATTSDGEGLIATKTVDGQVFYTGHTLSVQGDIGVNFYLNLSAEQAETAKVSFTWTVNGTEKTETVDLKDATHTSNGYKASCHVAPAEMTCAITASLTVGGEEQGEPNVFSAKDYANVILSDAYASTYTGTGDKSYENLKALVLAMLDYGTRAQARFEKELNTPANGGVYTYDDSAVSPAMIPQMMSNMDASAYGLEYTGSTVVLLAQTSIRHYYKITDPSKFGPVMSGVTFNGASAEYTEKGSEIYYELKNISAAQLDKAYILHIGDTDYAYSVMDYIRIILGKTGDDANELTQAMVAAMYYYNQKANAFFGEENVEPERYEWVQTSLSVRSYLAEANYDPSDYSDSVIVHYAPEERSLSDERPSGATINIKQAGTLTVGGYSQQVEAGDFTVYNVIPNSDTPFSVISADGKLVQWGTINPTHFLRQIKSPNSRNIRDLGGWACDGGTVKYGKIIRGGAVTPDDREVLVNQVGVRTDIELRGTNDNNWTSDPPMTSPLGDDLNYHIYDQYAWYSFSRKALCKQIIGDIFESVRNGDTVYMHCHAGADRTGTMAFILEAVLGVAQSDMDMDFELTTYYVGSKNARCRNNADEWLSLINEINAKSGATIRDKAVSCLLDLGFTIDEINEFRAAMIDGTPEILTVG